MVTARTRWWIVAAAAVSIVVLGGVAWWLRPVRQPADEPLARQYRDFTACLLTDDRGISGPEAAPMWAGIQDAALTERVRSQYLTVAGPQTAENAATFLASLAQGQCDLVFAAGSAPAEAVRRGAQTFPRIRFLVVHPGTTAPNVSEVDSADVRGSANRLVATAAGAVTPQR
jgi:basic membrane lipoprotein Med (substrate-binding protein (PBP1-ABC) superfamily)